MLMLKILYPYEYVESVFSIDYTKLHSKGYRGIIFDIDNTLVHHYEASTKETDELFQAIHGIGLKTILLSNADEERVKRFIEKSNSLYIHNYIHDARKPSINNYLKAIKILGIKKDEALVIGDQIFTDILGANRSRIDNILVKYMRYPNEKKIGKRRTVEKFILKSYKNSKRYQNRIGDIIKTSE
jgi:HAD superfamily phosphatase (TIGR01668 family)